MYSPPPLNRPPLIPEVSMKESQNVDNILDQMQDLRIVKPKIDLINDCSEDGCEQWKLSVVRGMAVSSGS